MSRRAKFLLIASVAMLAALAVAANRLLPVLRIGSAAVAISSCGSHFVSGRSLESIRADELSAARLAIFETVVDEDDRSATAGLAPFLRAKALYRDGLGCTLVPRGGEAALRAQAAAIPKRPSAPKPWPRWAANGASDIDAAAMETALDNAFREPDANRQRRTRAVLVVFEGRIVAERYAPGFSAETPLLGWSMTKSVVNALVGILVRQGRLDILQPAPVPEWRSPGDPRGAITLDQLLRMSSGLAFVEVYDRFPSHALEMLMGEGSADAGAYAAAQALAAEPGSAWSYSSGTSNIVARIVRRSVGGTLADQVRFARAELFDAIDMSHAVIQSDASGTFVGSSFMYATARDWARFGLLYLRDGVWNGRRILPEGWRGYSVAATREAPRGEYGAHWWLNAGAPGDPSDRPFPRVPRDLFYASGYEGQAVAVVPSRDLVVVRLGNSQRWQAWSLEDLVADVLAALPGS
jgi:CubicO group peptidase (beta-lactamase class C family)